MWKRFSSNNAKGAQPSMSIGTPILHETTLDGRDYPGLDLPSPPQEHQLSPRTPRTPLRMETKGLPNLPLFEALPPSPPSPQESAYSQPYLNTLNTHMPRDSYNAVRASYTDGDVSPPSSPEMGGIRRHRNANVQDDDVSPIDETLDMSQLEVRRPESRTGSSSAQASSIPVLRREKRRNQVANAAANLVTRKEVGTRGRPTQDPRWDPYSGEITTSDKGKPQSVKPGQYTPPTLRTTHNPGAPALGNESSISAGVKPHTSFGDRVRNLKINNNNSSERPEWKGASGRVTLVSPVADQVNVKPLNIPRKSSRRVASREAMSPVSLSRPDETGELTSPLTFHPTNKEQQLRVVSSNTGPNSTGAVSPISVIHDPHEVLQSAAVQTQAQGYPAPKVSPLPRDDTSGTIVRNFRDALAESFPETKDPYDQPPSKFSVTTYTPSEDPRPSTDTYDRPEIPPVPTQAPSPIVNRKRPQVLGDTPRMPRKALAPSSPVFISMSTSVTRKRQSQLSILSKNLPLSPAEASSNDLISSLLAQIDNLQHRRKNIASSIRQMTELMPQDNLTITQEVRRKRELEKQKVEGLRDEEADIRKEEHELGLKLHRAYKRKDKDAVYEPTTLWVRRVTG